MLTAVRWISPRAISSSTAGNRRATRAAVIRFPAAHSDMCSRSTQNANRDEHACPRCNPLTSTSPRYASSSAVISFDRPASTSTRSSTRSSDIDFRQSFSMLPTYHARKTPLTRPPPPLSRPRSPPLVAFSPRGSQTSATAHAIAPRARRTSVPPSTRLRPASRSATFFELFSRRRLPRRPEHRTSSPPGAPRPTQPSLVSPARAPERRRRATVSSHPCAAPRRRVRWRGACAMRAKGDQRRRRAARPRPGRLRVRSRVRTGSRRLCSLTSRPPAAGAAT